MYLLGWIFLKLHMKILYVENVEDQSVPKIQKSKDIFHEKRKSTLKQLVIKIVITITEEITEKKNRQRRSRGSTYLG